MFSFLPLLAMLTIGCAATPVVLTPNASDVRTGKADPSENAKELGPVTGTNGAGCGLYGYRGTYERAYSQLKNSEHSVILTFLVIAVDSAQTPDRVCRYIWHSAALTCGCCAPHTTRPRSA